MTDLPSLITQAQTLAIARLIEALETAEDPAEIRRLSQAILALDPEDFARSRVPTTAPASTPPRNTTHSVPASKVHRPTPPPPRPQSPLTDLELAALQSLLPHVKPDRFLRKHTPEHWRSVLAQHALPVNPRAAPAALAGAA